MKELYFVRHGQTEWNAIRRMQGQWNSDLSTLGRKQASRNGEFLKQFDIDYVVASPLDRTRQTAELIVEHLGIDYAIDTRIKEWHCGDWSGEMWGDLAEKWPEDFAAWQSDQFDYRAPGGENYPDMIARSKPFLSELLASQHRTIVVVSHGMIGRAMVGSLLSMSAEEMLSFSQANDVVIHLTRRNGEFVAQHYVAGQGPFEQLPARS